MPESFPPMIGKYKILGVIAHGGMGVVYKAEHPSLKRFVVIKKMTARGNNANAERFKREAQILLDLQSSYIVHLFDYFTEGGYRYMVEELVDGFALDKLIARQKVLPPEIALLVVQDACYALKCAHNKGIIHRDIKPGNILISKRAEIKLADFGIAGEKEKEADEPSLTRTGIALGTPAYMPPEQYENCSKVDQRADIYALGVMLYEMTTGAKPFPGTLSMETLNRIRKGKYIPPQKIDRTIPSAACSLIKKMMRPNPRRRFQSVDPIIRIVQRYLKHYDIHEIRVQLAKAIISPKAVVFSGFVPKDLTRRKVRRAVSMTAAAAAAFAVLWYGGFIHRTILRSLFTPVDVQMQMPASALEGSDLPVRAFFFGNDGNDIPEIAGSRRIFTEQREKPAGGVTVSRPAAKVRTYTIKTVFLKPGDYRIKVVAGPYVWWKSFTVAKKNQLIQCDFLKGARRPLTVRPHAYDAATGDDITLKTAFSVLYNGSWRLLSDMGNNMMISGTVWKIKASCPGYNDELFSLLLDWYQDELFISANLTHTAQ
ncbi:MAG TPA: serine/threonine protein kinase [Treponema sp.]|nr:serine/threonine protein kinase [Treponema sp.]